MKLSSLLNLFRIREMKNEPKNAIFKIKIKALQSSRIVFPRSHIVNNKRNNIIIMIIFVLMILLLILSFKKGF